MSRVDMRDATKIYHPMTLATLQGIAPGFDWPGYFAGVGAPSFTTINVEQPAYMKTMAKVISTETLPALKSYLRLHAVDPVAPYLSTPFEEASFKFFNANTAGAGGRAAPLETLHHVGRQGAERRRWPEVGSTELPAGKQGRSRTAYCERTECSSRGDREPFMDVSRSQAGGGTQGGHHA